MGAAWSISGMIGIAAELGDRWPGCADDLTPEMRYGARAAPQALTAPRRGPSIERAADGAQRGDGPHLRPATASTSSSRASNPDVAFAAEGPLPVVVRRHRGGRRQQRPADVPGQPPRQPGDLDPGRRRSTACRSACRSIGRHFTEPLLLDLALVDGAHPPVAARRPGRTLLTPTLIYISYTSFTSDAGATMSRAATQRALAAGLVMAITLNAFEAVAVVTAMPAISEELDGDRLYGAAFSAYMLANLVALVVSGEQADRRGPAVPVPERRGDVRDRPGGGRPGAVDARPAGRTGPAGRGRGRAGQRGLRRASVARGPPRTSPACSRSCPRPGWCRASWRRWPPAGSPRSWAGAGSSSACSP